jgi:hypothetical protein
VPTTLPVCPALGGITCNDDDPCTDDTCTPAGCDNVPKVGLESVTCTCEQALPTVCAAEELPRSVKRNTTRACRLFSAAVTAKPRGQVRKLRQGARALQRAAAAVVRAQVRGLSPECAAALYDQYLSASDRAAAAANQITP